MMERNDRISFVESISTVAWFCIDVCWMFEYMNAAILFAAFCIFTNAAIVIYKAKAVLDSIIFGNSFSYSAFSEFLMEMAIFFWLLMNVTWMVEMLPAAKTFFVLGSAFIILSVVFSKDRMKAIMNFRRFRI